MGGTGIFEYGVEEVEVLHVIPPLERNTYCTWSKVLKHSPYYGQQLLVDKDGNSVSFDSLKYDGDTKDMDLGGGMQDVIREYKRLKDAVSTFFSSGNKKIVTGGTDEDRKQTVQDFTQLFPHIQFYTISAENEGRLTLESCIQRFVALIQGYTKVFMFARGSKDLHMACYVPDQKKPGQGETTKSDTVKYDDKPEEYATKFVDEVGNLTMDKVAVIFAGKSLFQDFADDVGQEKGSGVAKTAKNGEFKQLYNAFPSKAGEFPKTQGETYTKTMFAKNVFEHMKGKTKDVQVFVGSRN